MSIARPLGTRITDPLRAGNFRWLFAGITLSRFGSIMSFVVISWLALGLGGPQAVGLVAFAGGAGAAATAPLIGYLLDRLGLRALMLADNLARGALMVGLAALAGHLRLSYLVGFSILAALLSPATEIGQNVGTPLLTDPAELDAANRLLASSWSLSGLAGPALAGLGLVAGGAAWVLLADAATFFAMAGTALLMPGRPVHSHDDSSGRGGVLSGFRVLRRDRAIGVLAVVGTGVLFLDGMMEVFLPAFNKLALHQGPGRYGLLLTVAGAASLSGTLLLGRLWSAPALAALLTVRAVTIAPLAAVGSWGVAAAVVAVASVPDGSVYPVIGATQQRLIPAEVRGRVQGVNRALAAIGFPVGSALSGALVAAAGAGPAAVIIAALYLPLMAAIVMTPQLMRASVVAGR